MNAQKPPGQPIDVRAWDDLTRSPGLFVQPEKFLTPETKVFTMGSCFALEIHRALTRKGYAVYPRYKDVAFDRSLQMFDKIPEREATPHRRLSAPPNASSNAFTTRSANSGSTCRLSSWNTGHGGLNDVDRRGIIWRGALRCEAVLGRRDGQ